jgi:N-acetylneuraminic acid mutarotase
LLGLSFNKTQKQTFLTKSVHLMNRFLLSLLLSISIFSLSAQTTTWTNKANLPEYRYSGAGFSIGGKGYIVGGYYSATVNGTGAWTNTVLVYNPSTNSWSSGPNYPVASSSFAYPFAFVIGGVAYVGSGGSTSFYAFDGTTWTAKTSRPSVSPNCFIYPVSFTVGGKGYVGDGYLYGQSPIPATSSAIYNYNPTTNAWANVTTSVPSLQGASVMVNNGKAYICGGNWLGNGNQNRLIEWDPSSNSVVEKTAHPNSAVCYAPGFSFVNSGIVVSGNNSASNDWYDFASDTWSSSDAIPVGTQNAAYFSIGSDIYVAGGTDASFSTHKNILQKGATVLTALPVNWLSFSAKVAHSSVQLDWSTALELNNSHYEIERSADAQLFVKIGSVSASASPNIKNDYRYVDLQPLSGTSFYRLKQVDFDGKFSYSSIIQINGVLSNEFKEWYDNLSKKIAVQVPQLYTSTADLIIFDALGRVVSKSKILPGLNYIQASNYTRGMYFSKISVLGKVVYSNKFEITY